MSKCGKFIFLVLSKQLNYSNMNSKKRKRKIEKRICAVTSDQKRVTNTFHVVFSLKTDDVYIIPEEINNDIKISIHESGEVHTALSEKYAVVNNIPNQKRYLDKHFLADLSQLTEEETLRFEYEVAACVGFLPTETIDISSADLTKEDQLILTFGSKREMIIVLFLVSISHEAHIGGMRDIDILYKTTFPKSRREFVIGVTKIPMNKDLVIQARSIAKKMIDGNSDKKNLGKWFSSVLTTSEDLPDALVEWSTSNLPSY